MAALPLVAALAFAAPAAAHKADPNYLTRVDAITPPRGVTVEVINRDDQLELHNTSGEDVVIEGYDDDPYARVAADGTVEVNTQLARLLPQRGPLRRRRRCPNGIDGAGRAEVEGARQDRALRVARPPHALDGEVRAAAGQRPGQAHEDLRLVGPDDGRRDGRATSPGTLFWTPEPGAPVGLHRRRLACSSSLLCARRDRRPAARGAEPARAGDRGLVRRCASSLAAAARSRRRRARTRTLEGTTPDARRAARRAPGAGRAALQRGGRRRARRRVRVFDATGREVQRGEAFHPADADAGGRRSSTPACADGGYTATYRVISADSHPVSRRLLVHGRRRAAPGRRASTGCWPSTAAGPVTATALGVARARAVRGDRAGRRAAAAAACCGPRGCGRRGARRRLPALRWPRRGRGARRRSPVACRSRRSQARGRRRSARSSARASASTWALGALALASSVAALRRPAPLPRRSSRCCCSPAFGGHAERRVAADARRQRRPRRRHRGLDRRPRRARARAAAATALGPGAAAALLAASRLDAPVAVVLATGIVQSIIELSRLARADRHRLRPRDPDQARAVRGAAGLRRNRAAPGARGTPVRGAAATLLRPSSRSRSWCSA